jgi:hypothetical protein
MKLNLGNAVNPVNNAHGESNVAKYLVKVLISPMKDKE